MQQQVDPLLLVPWVTRVSFMVYNNIQVRARSNIFFPWPKYVLFPRWSRMDLPSVPESFEKRHVHSAANLPMFLVPFWSLSDRVFEKYAWDMLIGWFQLFFVLGGNLLSTISKHCPNVCAVLTRDKRFHTFWEVVQLQEVVSFSCQFARPLNYHTIVVPFAIQDYSRSGRL